MRARAAKMRGLPLTLQEGCCLIAMLSMHPCYSQWYTLPAEQGFTAYFTDRQSAVAAELRLRKTDRAKLRLSKTDRQTERLSVSWRDEQQIVVYYNG